MHRGDGCSLTFLTGLCLLTIVRSWNDASKHAERERQINVNEFKRLAAAAVNQKVADVARFEKLAEGEFNRSFLITMRNGFQFVGRIPYTVTEPKRLVVASEVATIDFLRSHGITVPKMYSYSANSNNPAGTEYIFMELIRGTNLGDVWFELSAQARNIVVQNLVKLESQIFQISIPANGSIYYTKDLPAKFNRVEFPSSDATPGNRFCIGSETRL